MVQICRLPSARHKCILALVPHIHFIAVAMNVGLYRLSSSILTYWEHAYHDNMGKLEQHSAIH